MNNATNTTNAAVLAVVTHDGVFHADEVVAYAVLSELHKCVLTRTRDTAVIEAADIVLDVGRVYDPANGRFDHHQARGGVNGCASAGLVWLKHGVAYCMKIGCQAELAEKVSQRVYDALIADVDAIDVGNRRPAKGEYTLSHAIGSFNRPRRPGLDSDFYLAVEVASQVLENEVWTAIAAERDSLSVREMIALAPSNVLVLHKYYTGMMDVVQEENPARATRITRLVYPDPKGSWRVQVVEGEEYLPEAWRGKEGPELSAVTGAPGCVFCHIAGFICGNDTREGAIAMAYAS